MKNYIYACLVGLGIILSHCSSDSSYVLKETQNKFYPTSKPMTRWWWFATEIKPKDVKHQLEWLKSKNFGGVEIAWVYPLHRYQKQYIRNQNRHYKVDTSAQKWLSKEWTEIVSYTKRCADSLGLACDFTFGSAWPVAASNLDPKYGTQVYGDSTFRQTLTFAWSWPDTQLVINHLDEKAFIKFSEPIEPAIKEPLKGSKSALFTDSWEIKLNSKYKIWTPGFEDQFKSKFGYDIIPYMEEGLDSFPDVRYDYMLLLDEYVTNGFYKPYVEKCKELGAWSRVQCLASPTDVMTTYGMVDIPETEAMLNNPNYSRIVSSSAALSGKELVSCESFTCMYGFPMTYLRDEQTADLKLVADALFAQGVNHHVYHGTPYNPIGSDTIEFFATTFFAPGGSLEPELADFNKYIESVSGIMQQGKVYSDIAMYIPYEDGVMQGAYPPERQRVWVWGEYELRYIYPPKEIEGYNPLWINRHFLNEATFDGKKLLVGDASFNALYIDVKYMDARAIHRILSLAKEGLPVVLKSDPLQPGKSKSDSFREAIRELRSLDNVASELPSMIKSKPLISGDFIPDYWCREKSDGSLLIFISQPLAKDLKYPVCSGQSLMEESEFVDLTFNFKGNSIQKKIEFKPYQSVILEISPEGKITEIDINFIPKQPKVKPKEKQRMHF